MLQSIHGAEMTLYYPISAEPLLRIGQRIQNGPEGLARITAQLVLLHTEIKLLDDLDREGSLTEGSKTLSDETLNLLKNAIRAAKQTIISIRDACDQCARRHGITGKIRWAFLDNPL
jgi:hypothetical protein